MNNNDFSIASINFDSQSGELTVSAQTLRLEPRASSVLARLCETRSVIVSRQELLDQCWGQGEGSDEALTQAIAQIRRGFERLGESGDFVQTHPKRGYRLLNALSRPDQSVTPMEADSIEKPAARNRKRLRLLVIAVGVIALALGIWMLIDPHGLRHLVRHSLGLHPGATY